MSGFKSKPKAEISEFARYKIRQIQIEVESRDFYNKFKVSEFRKLPVDYL